MANDKQYIQFGDEVIEFPADMSDTEIAQVLQKQDPDYQKYADIYINDTRIPDGYVPTFPEYKQMLKQSKADTERRANRTIGDKLIGAGETALTIGSAIGSSFLAPFVWGGESIKDLVTGQPVADFEKSFGEIVQAGTYQPRTEAGQEYTRNVGDVIEESKIEGALGLPVLGSLRGSGMGIRQGLSKVGQGVSKTGEAIGKVLPKREPKVPTTDGGLASQFFGMTTGAGKNPLRIAYETGKKGTQQEVDAFLKGMEGNASPESLVQRANNALSEMKKQIGIEYQANKAKLQADKSQIKFDEIDNALEDIAKQGKFEGEVINPSTVKIQEEITKIVNKWKGLDPKKYHTPEGIDALKRRIGDLYDSTQYGTQERLVVDKVYNQIGDTIRKNAPTYDKMMSDYAEGRKLVREIQDTFSMKKDKPTDTQFRKLTSILRDGVNANFGERFNLAQKLNELDPTLFPELAGQSLESWTPRGIQRAIGTANVGLQGTNLGLNVLGGGINPFVAFPALLSQSPKVVGKGAFALGRGARGIQNMKGLISDAIKTPNIPTVSSPTTSQALTLPAGILGTTYPEEL